MQDLWISPSLPADIYLCTPHSFIGSREEHLHCNDRRIREQANAGGLTDPEQWEQGISGLVRTTGPGAMFCSPFFKATGRKEVDPKNLF
jgi:hypothetical protein